MHRSPVGRRARLRRLVVASTAIMLLLPAAPFGAVAHAVSDHGVAHARPPVVVPGEVDDLRRAVGSGLRADTGTAFGGPSEFDDTASRWG